jgi:predicted type IV restriction endonuclease
MSMSAVTMDMRKKGRPRSEKDHIITMLLNQSWPWHRICTHLKVGRSTVQRVNAERKAEQERKSATDTEKAKEKAVIQ